MSSSELSEFELIGRFFAGRDRGAGVTLGLGDDCALLAPRAGHELAVSVDTLVAGTHFFPDQPAAAIGHKALAAALSDLAAMGAEPLGALLALTLPAVDTHWLHGFIEGWDALADRLAVPLVGGDTTRGPLAASVTVFGQCPTGRALRRAGARPGDLVVVSGALGGAAAGLQAEQTRRQAARPRRPQAGGSGSGPTGGSGGRPASEPAIESRAGPVTGPSGGQAGAPGGAGADRSNAAVCHRFFWPEPRLALGLALRDRALAAIDVSDGVLADLGHLCRASGCGASVHIEALPIDPQLATWPREAARVVALTGGEDFELLFAWPPDERRALAALAQHTKLALTVIGQFTTAPGVQVRDAQDRVFPVAGTGFDHFSPLNRGG